MLRACASRTFQWHQSRCMSAQNSSSNEDWKKSVPKATKRALNRLDKQALPKNELKRRMVAYDGYEEFAAEKAVEKLGIDDVAYSCSFTIKRVVQGHATEKLWYDLRRMGVTDRDASAGIERALQRQGESKIAEHQLARARSHFRRVKHLPEYKRERRMIGWLAYRGFSFQQAKKMYSQLIHEHEQDDVN